MSQISSLRFFTLFAVFQIFTGILFIQDVTAGSIKDSESALHASTASKHVIVETYRFPGVKIIQINLAVLSHYSYMVISGKDALVVDPDRDIEFYLDTAKIEEVVIKGVFLTHSHADFVAGHHEFVKAVGCPIYQSRDSGALYKTVPISDGQEISLGKIKIRFIETPGHTPDGFSALVFSEGNNEVPVAILTGDTLFVGSVGRPDLLGGNMPAAVLASKCYDTWVNKLSKLDDSVMVLPAHGAGSLCGAHLKDEPSSTIGAERATNPYLQHKGKNDFITAVLESLPEAPQYFKYNAKMNREGPPLVDWDSELPKVTSLNSSLSDVNKNYVLDLRNSKDFAAGHIPNSVNIALRGRIETWGGIMVPWGSNLILCGDRDQVKEAQLRLSRVGYSAAEMIAMDDWVKAGQPLYKNELIQPEELYSRIKNQKGPIVVDVRLPTEWMGARIGDILNMPLNKLNELAVKLDPNEEIITVCNSAYRSSMGIGILERLGFTKVASMEGGGQAWIDAGLPIVAPIFPGSVSGTSKYLINFPDIIESAALKRMIMDAPNTFEIIDIRPAEYFKDYNISGSTNVDIAEIINNPAYLSGTVPLVIVDRNGSMSLIVAGILSQKTQRRIKVLFGGLAAYWSISEMNNPIRAVPLSMQAITPNASGKTAVRDKIMEKPIPPKRQSAGC